MSHVTENYAIDDFNWPDVRTRARLSSRGAMKATICKPMNLDNEPGILAEHFFHNH